ncbi:MAG: PPOX class F420-dependent oxidoreductase [Ilumatobacteraceae bacterium]
MGIADEKYVLLTTFRRTGAGVSSAVWIAPLPDGSAGFTTGATSGKVKRIRNNPSVTLCPCDMRGRTEPGAVAVSATATVLLGPDAAPITAAIKAKYRLMVTLMTAGSKAKGLLSKAEPEPDCVVQLRFDH